MADFVLVNMGMSIRGCASVTSFVAINQEVRTDLKIGDVQIRGFATTNAKARRCAVTGLVDAKRPTAGYSAYRAIKPRTTNRNV